REEQDSKARIKEIHKELNELIGLQNVKKMIFEVQAFVEIQKRRAQEKLAAESTVLHAVFKGNPGTGKTTVARIVARLFKEVGVLQKGHLVEVERADLVGEYIGHTAQKTREQIKKAIGGILFIDEAYSLARGGEKDFGKEAIDVIVKEMEDNKDNLIIILAGYKEEMDWFLSTNPGLRSRFPLHIEFLDYRPEELYNIAHLMYKARQYQLSDEARGTLERIIKRQVLLGHEYSGNARLVRNLVESSLRTQAVRLVNKQYITRDDLMLIQSIDLLDAARRCQ
ncbi:MAG: AAA family ATPase, partial [Bacillota bacterium]